ncbi:MAG: ABC transporter permease [Chitinophagales bacterium]|nr:ABC transporter permease [Chitinophagaceae bacterium]MCB9064623.1 ABC transporter permease [Chitinophagales bacterium]
MNKENASWSIIIEPTRGLFSINFKEIWQYRDLVLLLVKRDFIAFYKQTILGPLWFAIQPILTTAVYVLLFNKVAHVSTEGVPPILFQMAGITCWMYFSEVLIKTSDTFITNANIFGKVYFPRIVIPLSITLSSMIRLGIQMGLFFVILAYYYFFTDSNINFTWAAAMLPALIILMGLQALGLGIIISSLTSKYRDLKYLLTFGIQLLQFTTTVAIPLSQAEGTLKSIFGYHPFTAIIETFRFGFLGSGQFYEGYFIYSVVFTFISLAVGLLIFNKIERTFMDTV